MLKRGKFVDISERAIVSLVGSESLDLLQRISTNDVAKLSTDGSVQTVLANEKGRIVDVVSVLHYDGDGLLVVGQSTDPVIMKQWIEKYIIMEDITVMALTDRLTHLMVYNSTQDMGGLTRLLSLGNCGVFVETLGSVKLVHVLACREFRDAAIKWLVDVGFVQTEASDYEEYRVTQGIPSFPSELSTSYNPLEAGLIQLVSFAKGCYVGQEVVARLDTYKKVQRRLVKLKMLELPKILPKKLFLEGEECGSMTSAVRLSGSRECRGLGYLKSDTPPSVDRLCFDEEGTEVKVFVDSQRTWTT
jgi:folate-binding protein YgfZ